jgi:hypothetical protein
MPDVAVTVAGKLWKTPGPCTQRPEKPLATAPGTSTADVLVVGSKANVSLAPPGSA